MIVNQSFYQHKLIPDMYFSLWTLCRQNNITWTKLAHRHCSDCTAPAGPLLFSVPDGSLVFLRLHLRWLTASVCMCVYTLSCFPPPRLCAQQPRAVSMSICVGWMTLWSPGVHLPGGTLGSPIIACWLEPNPNKFHLPVSTRLEPFPNSQSRKHRSPLRNSHSHTHTHTHV